MQEKTDSKVIIYSSTDKVEIPSTEILDFHSTASVESFCASLELTIKGLKKEIRDLIEPKTEIEIWVKILDNWEKIDAGYIDKIVLEKKEGSEEILQIYGRSYESILVDTKISGTIEFTQGYSEVIRAILKDTPYVEGEVENSSEKGKVSVKGISLMELIKNITEHNNWIFRVDKDKKYYFTKNLPQKNIKSLGPNDIKGYRIVKQ